MKWYYLDGDKTVGPLASSSMQELRACGMITAETQVRQESGEEWVRFEEAFNIVAPATPASNNGEVIKFHCTRCQQKISAESARAGQSVECPACGAELIIPTSALSSATAESSGKDETEQPPQPSKGDIPPQTYYVLRNGDQAGPYSTAEITAKISAGELTAEDLCWTQGMAGWESIAKTLSLGAGTPPPPLPPGQSLPSKAESPGVLDASKNLTGSLAALGGALCKSIKSAATSEAAQQATHKVVEASSKLRTRAVEMASTEAHHGQQSAPTSDQEGSTTGPPAPPASTEVAVSNTRHINWIPALVFFCLSAAFIVIVNLASIDGNEDEAAMIALVGLPIMVLGVIFTSLLHHKCWKTLPSSFRATTPGKAVGFMFIPFYNFYWGFVSLPKLPEGLANWQKSVGVNPTSASGLGTTLAILFICYSVMAMLSIHLLVALLAIAALVIYIIYYKKVVSGFNQMVAASTVVPVPILAGFWNFKRTAISMAVVLPIYWLILGITYDPDTPSSGGYSSEARMPTWYNEVQSMKTLPCYSCGGSGVDKVPSHCFKCSGAGTVTTVKGYEIVCPTCGGTGKKTSSCRVCGGSGQLRK